MKSLIWKPLGLILAVLFFWGGFQWVMQPQRLSLRAIPLPVPRYIASEKLTAPVHLKSPKKSKTILKK